MYRVCSLSSRGALTQISRAVSSSATYARPVALSLDTPTLTEEADAFDSRVAAGSLPPLPLPSTLLADKLYAVFDRAAKEGKPVHTLGAIDPVQMTQMARWLEVMYVSGWAASSVLTTANNEVGPDLGDYPYTTVPNQVHRLFRAQQLHDRKHYDQRVDASPEERAKMPYIDYLRPIIADADTGHGGTSAVMKLVKLFAESGASAIHLEDQLHGGKKCGHLSGKVVVPTSAHIARLIASRFQLDLLQHTMLLIARTDAESARLLSSTVDARDHPYIQGVRTRLPDGSRRPALAEVLDRAESEGQSVKLHTFDEAVEQAIQESAKIPSDQKASMLEQYREVASRKSNTEARNIAASIVGSEIDWDWDSPRTREGYYHTTGGIDAAVSRTLAFAPYADLIWLETKTPDLKQAQSFARQIRENPSFNWSAHGYSALHMGPCTEGFVLQLVSLAGLHSNAVGFAELAQRFKTDGMLAYVETVQRKRRRSAKWSGADYIDRILSTLASGSSSTSSRGKDSTEHSF
ncbi:isocitrate lyase and phosphorylmutase [Lactarius quietus]|nr:isocitrate lyase and phosphorylmutase [Lactarius quietus]